MTQLKEPSGPSPLYKQLLLTLAVLLGMVMFYKYEIYQFWYEQRAVRNWDLFQEQRESDITEEQKKQESWGNGYMVSAIIAQYFEERHISNPEILLEPNDYLEKKIGFRLPEPIVIYYFTEGKVRAHWMASKKHTQAKYMLYLDPRGVNIQPISSPAEMDSIMNLYKNYKDQL